MDSIKILPFGGCRINNPFSYAATSDSRLRPMSGSWVPAIYTFKEIIQIIDVWNGDTHIPADIAPFLSNWSGRLIPQPGLIAEADVVLLAPSNPVVSIGAIVSVPGLRAALRNTSAPVVGISPVIDNRPLRGMADECLSVLGVESSAQGIAEHYGPRKGNGILDGWLIADGDHAQVDGMTVGSAPLLMTDPPTTAQMVRAACALVGVPTPEANLR